MFEIKWKEDLHYTHTVECNDLQRAMEYAKTVDKFVTITGNGMEIVGIFGVDSIKDGICPDGVEYSWKKRRR